MPKIAKKFAAASALVDRNKRYPVAEGFQLLKKTVEARATKFDQTVDVAINLGVDPKHADQMVRGAVVLPHGTGAVVRVAVFAKGEKATEAEGAGADFVGADDLVKKVQEGFLDFDTVIATPDMMGQVGRLGKILGRRGLMPNPKAGTVTFDVTRAVREVKAGKIEFRVDKGGNVHAPIGKVSFAPEALEANFTALMDQIVRSKPAAAKGVYVRNVAISSTMGPGLAIDTTPYR